MGTPESQVKGDQNPSWPHPAHSCLLEPSEGEEGCKVQVTGQRELNVSLSVKVSPLAGHVAEDSDPSSVCLRLNSTVGVVTVVP